MSAGRITACCARLQQSRIVLWALGSSSLIYAWSSLVPRKLLGDDLDGSWLKSAHVAFANRMQFGKEYVFTVGPWGFLFGGYFPETYVLSTVSWLILTVLLWWT